MRTREQHRVGYAAGAACVAVVLLAIATIAAFPAELSASASKGWSFWFAMIGCVLGAGSAIPKLIPTAAHAPRYNRLVGRMWVVVGLGVALLAGCGDDGAPRDAVPCGDGLVRQGETCDTAIPAGAPGACPTSCPAPGYCETVALVGAACLVECDVQPIVDAIDGDGCCPPPEDGFSDSDCIRCGNGVVEPGESCDYARIVVGDGCDDACQCEPGVCGDSIVNCGESCDDGATTPGDGCDVSCRLEAAAYRITELYLRDPHMFGVIADTLCPDITDVPFGVCGFNCLLNEGIGLDGDGDGLFDLSHVLVFRPLDSVALTAVDLVTGADCTQTACAAGPDTSVSTRVATSELPGGADCLAPLPGTLHTPPYSPPVLTTPAPCFVTTGGPWSLGVGVELGFTLAFSDAQLAAVWWGDPVTGLMTGLIRGFVPESVADTTLLADSLPYVGGQPLSEVLVGGTNNCQCDHGAVPMGCDSDLDVGPDGVTPGWYLYFEFEAKLVDWIEP